MKKKFDCVEMKHKAALKIRKEIKELGANRELEYWKKAHQQLIMRKSRLLKAHK